jgi:hypothetical protein
MVRTKLSLFDLSILTGNNRSKGARSCRDQTRPLSVSVGAKKLLSFSKKVRALTGLRKHGPTPSYLVKPSHRLRCGEMCRSYGAKYGFSLVQKRYGNDGHCDVPHVGP